MYIVIITNRHNFGQEVLEFNTLDRAQIEYDNQVILNDEAYFYISLWRLGDESPLAATMTRNEA